MVFLFSFISFFLYDVSIFFLNSFFFYISVPLVLKCLQHDKDGEITQSRSSEQAK